jgi:hypothetical protein
VNQAVRFFLQRLHPALPYPALLVRIHPQRRRRTIMTKLSTYAFVIVLCLGTTALLATSGQTSKPSQGSEERFAADGAFRDGLHLGRFAAQHGQPSRPCSGRWSREHDRSMFTAGYHRGYLEFLAVAGTNAQQVQPAE